MSDKINGTSSLINKSQVRKILIQHAQDTRAYWRMIDNPRVSEQTLQKIEAEVSASIRNIVEKLPSKGKTI